MYSHHLIADQSDHDLRDDMARELMTVNELLKDEGRTMSALQARQAAQAVITGEISLDRGNEILCALENRLGG
ncbi:hypothetical protein BJD46_gp86 [Mycobacterium phage Bactobuster]|uniref:DUF7273 domain-containing protein n=1 Tax=Mycobacterium phage Bactobuster TaxID=1784956 RepID=A0A127KQ12_9CAUD|nr:hypothetical protein BJD46_gp86 [Mycobacterium phage Bactobuster]AMO44054.1 hypothetical protein SEA_BACTOBUSTER_86 [Mycobacterium phage Bactobuster]